MISGRSDIAVCCREESDRFVDNFDGWQHWVPPADRHRPGALAANLQRHTVPVLRDFGGQFEQLHQRFNGSARSLAAQALGLNPEAFDHFALGFDCANGAVAFPAMRVKPPFIVGVRFRRLTPAPGQPKWWSSAGTTGSLLIPLVAEDAETLVLTEGPSDCLAAAQTGVRALGRWSCRLDALQANAVADYATAVGAKRVLVYGDNDDLADPTKVVGKRGAEIATEALRQTAQGIEVLHRQPPAGIKDLREWVQAGATAYDILGGGKGVAA